MSDMTACLNDLSYIPLNNEQNEQPRDILFRTFLRLQRLYKSSHTAKEMTWHATGEVYGAREFPNKDMKEEFPGWFGKQIRQRHIDNDPSLSKSSELFALACGPSQTPISDDRDVIHVDNSSDLALSTSLNDLKIAALHIDGQSIDVDVPPDIIDVVYEDDDIIDEEDPILYDLADSDDEDLINLDIDDGVNAMSADVARGHGGDGGGDDRPPPYQVPTGCGGCLGNRGKGTRKPNLGGRRAGRPHTRQETRNLGLKAITDKSGPVPIRFEVNDRETLMPLGDHAAHWANYLGELVRELPLHYPSWRQMSPERKAGVVAKIGGLGSNTSTGVPYTEDEILAIVRGGKQRGHIPSVGKVLSRQGTVKMFMKLFRSDDKFSQMLMQLESQPKYGGGSGSGGCGDDEPRDDEDGDEDEEDG
ncbi:hypothetical protein Tco_0942416 [Tanacetum coccineum]